MRVCRVEVDRFLGFKRLSLELDGELQLIAGPNNAGKSSIIRLLEAYFSDPSGLALAELLPLHAYYTSLGPRTLSTIQVWFNELTPAELEIFEPIVRADGRMWITIRCSRSGSVSYRASRNVSAEESQQLYAELLSRFHFVNIPSVRVGGGGDQNEPESLERLLDTLEAILVRTGNSRSTALQQEFSKKITPLEDLVREVLDDSASAIMGDLPFQEKTVKFRLPDARHALRGMLESAVIESQGDVDVPVAKRGTGFQSALVLGILRYVASRESQSGSNLVFAIEEPEAFLHPQTQRAMAKIIGDISNDAQVIMTTHSSVMIDSFALNQIARLPLQSGGTTHTWLRPELGPTDAGRLSRYCSAANSELVFASAVIFVEGEGDYAVVEKLLGRACQSPGGHYALGITVIEASGLGKIKYLVRLAELFGVRSYVLADRDGLHKRDGQRVLLTVLNERAKSPDDAVVEQLRTEADKPCTSLQQALKQQKILNGLLDPHDAFVLASDLEGLLLDSFGLPRLVEALGPDGEGIVDAQFAQRLLTDADGYETCAAWLGSKGWNSDRKKSGKMQPHLAPHLLDVWFSDNAKPPAAMKPLVDWLDGIVTRATLTPV
ncbi:hypothetical protein NOCA1190016 [metagenome]|uniref:Uncharacterized protein n=1 Tax=metagenome TaxID=256318 RepID=A0A2P2CCD2_9ZZZZ